MANGTSFYIKSVTVSSKGKKDSIVEFTPGLNILIGPSNSGKTKVLNCIAYVLGDNDSRPFDRTYHGYDTITVCICSPSGGETRITRALDSTTAEIESSEKGIKEGTYYYDTSKDATSVNHVLFSLLGIKEVPFKLAHKANSEKARASWHSIIRISYLDRTKLLNKKDFIEPTNSYEKYSLLSLLLYLIYGKEFCYKPREDKKTTKVKYNAKSEYISGYIAKLESRIEKNKNEIEQRFGATVPQSISAYSEKLEEIAAQINECVEKSNRLLSEVTETTDKLKEREISQHSFSELLSQYSADIDRLNSIVLGGDLLGYVTTKDYCPFCHNKISKEFNDLNIEAANSELSRILGLYNGLVETQKGVIAEIKQLKEKLVELNSEKENIQRRISFVLQPQYDEINEYISLTEEYNRLKTQAVFLNEMVSDMKMDDDNLKNDYLTLTKATKKEEYRPKTYFEEDFLSKMNEYSRKILRASGYKKYNSACFRLDTFNVDLQDISKEVVEGQGYCTFINTVTYLSLMKYLSTESVYKLGFLMIDTPLLGLKEQVTPVENEKIHMGYTETLVELGNYYQLIIAYQEDDLPQAFDRTKCRVIPLKMEGKKGFLVDYNQEEGEVGE